MLDLLIVNQGELAALAPYPISVAGNLAQLQCPAVVVTLGKTGCVARLGNTFLFQNAFEVDSVDTTGAGDTFCGSLVAALSLGQDMTTALRQASAAAALACTRPGAQSSIPDGLEVAAFLAQQNASADTQALRAYCGLA